MVDDAILTTEMLELGSESSYGLTPIPEFEPILNVEAASSFIIIAVLFTLLQIRVIAISNAAQRRSNALVALRQAESLLLSGGLIASFSDDNKTNTQIEKDIPSDRYSSMVAAAKKEYEDALRAELSLRSIAPGVRIVAPDDPRRNEEDRAAAKRFLGWGSEEFGDANATPTSAADNERLGVDKRNRSSGNVKRSEIGDDGGGGNANVNYLSNGDKIILAGVASMLILLLYTLSFDPMVMM